MKLDFDITRDLLLDLEKHLNLENQLMLSNSPVSSKSDDINIIYSALKLKEAGYIDAEVKHFLDSTYRVTIKSITWQGHQFLDTIRPQNSWDKAKSKALKIGGTSLSILSEIAVEVSKTLMLAQL